MVFPIGSRRSPNARKFAKGTVIQRKSLSKGLKRDARTSRTRYAMVTHGVTVPSHHTTVDVDIHSLCDFWFHGKE